MMKNNNSTSSDSGFTLLEILIAILILGIVSTIAVIGVSGTLSKSKDTACTTDVRSINNAMQAYYNDNPTSNPSADSGSSEYLYTGNTFSSTDLVGSKYFSPLESGSNPSYTVHLILLSAPSASPTQPTYQIQVYNSSNQPLVANKDNYYARDNLGNLYTTSALPAASPIVWTAVTGSTTLDPCKGV